MNKNIFEGAQFGDVFITRCGNKMIYRNKEGNKHYGIVEGVMNEVSWYDNGYDTFNNTESDTIEGDDDIVARVPSNLNIIHLDNIKNDLIDRINTYEKTCKEVMTKENVHTLTMGDKLTALGNINSLVYVIRSFIDPDFEYDFYERMKKNT